MLTILFLIHRWFYSTPKSCTSSISASSATSETNTGNRNGPISERQASSKHDNSCKSESLRNLKESSCKSNFLAVVAVCRISTSIKVPEKEDINVESEMSIEDKFRAAVRVIHSLPKDGPYQPSNSTKLKFYGLYKQATEGENKTGKPGFWDVIGRAKWEAWNKLGDMSKDAAMNQYVDCLKEIVETMSFNGDVEDFLDSIGPFYEFVTLQGNEMNHIKEKIEEMTSSSSGSGSSLANSVVPSGENSKENSPSKSLNGEENGEEETASTSEKAEVSVETSTATYETKASKNSKSFAHQNGNAFHTNSEDSLAIPPPAPVHSYSNQNGLVKHALPNENDDDEVLTVSTPYVNCKEDLERDIDDGSSSHRRVRVTSSIETVASNATSGTESEKYYSGDSEPEFDEKYASSLASFVNNESYPSTSAGTSQMLIGAQAQSVTFNNGSSFQKKPINSSLKKPSKERASPKNSSTVSPTYNPDVLTQQTVERLNRDVDHILARLRILEAAYAVNAEGTIRVPANQIQQRRRRIFGDLSIQSIAFIIMWPFVVHFLIKLLRWWWRRRKTLVRSVTYSRMS